MSNYIVLDLEMCTVPERMGKNLIKNEIIEIGAVRLNDRLEIIDSFKTYVSPCYGVLTNYIKELTGISYKDTDHAPTLGYALEKFISWLPENPVLVSWSDSDAAQIRRETRFKGFYSEKLADFIDTTVDCQLLFSQKMNTSKIYRLSEALVLADIDYDEGAHDALVDAHNTALLFAKLKKEDKLTLNPYFTEQEPPRYNPFEGLMALFSCTT